MQSGLEAIFLTTRLRLANFLRLRGAGEEADDLVQEVWIRASADTSGPISNPEGFLFRVAHNLMIDWHRSSRQRGLRERDWTDAQSGEVLEADARPNAERMVVDQSVLDLVVAEIDALGEPTRTIFRQFRVEGTAQREIANQLGISLPTVEKHLQKAYRKMAELRKKIDMD